jgi:hypothetical protein
VEIEQHWVFAGFCAAVVVLVVRLVVRERVTLQSSLAFLGVLGAMLVVAIFPGVPVWMAAKMGFALPSNFLFAMAIGALALLNVATLVTLSRVELRSIAVTQEVGLLREKVDRLAREHGQGTAREGSSAAETAGRR